MKAARIYRFYRFVREFFILELFLTYSNDNEQYKMR